MAGQECYTFGNCTWYVAGVVSYVRCGWGNATDWAAGAARDGLELTLQPTVGSVVCYRAGDHYSEFGHVALVQQVYGSSSFLVSEMNYVGFDQVDQRVSGMVDVEAFILGPGMSPGGGPGPGGGGSGAADVVRVEWTGIQDYLNGGADQQITTLRQLVDFVNAI